MGFFGMFGKKEVATELEREMPYSIRTEFVPYKIKSHERSNSSLVVNLKNLTGEPVMSSIVIDVPKQLSLDNIGLLKQKEVRLGTLGAKAEKESRIDIYSSVGTDKGDYTVTVTAFVHYRDYAHILNYIKKRTIIQAL